MPSSDHERILKRARRKGSVSASELAADGIHRQALTRLVAAGKLERVARGLYRPRDYAGTENQALAIVAARIPKSVVCLLSALAYHGIGTQLPFEVWIAIDRRAKRPTLPYPPLRVVRFSGAALTEGVKVHRLEGHPVRIYSPAKSVADCFKYRNKIGLDVAVEALREAWRERRCTMEELEHFAKVCRVSNVMRPYLQALVA
jgi:predicted transcriptional regulator of viral defense system